MTEEVENTAGITPDSPLWGLERAMERISLALTFGKSAKAQKGLAHAENRLAEVQVMVAQNKLEAAAKAQNAHAKTLAKVEEAVEELEDSDAEDELADLEDIEENLAEHQEQMNQFQENVRVQVKGQLSENQQAKLDEIVGSFQEAAGKVEVTMKAKKERTMIKVKLIEENTNGHGKQVTVQNQNIRDEDDGKQVKTEAQTATQNKGDEKELKVKAEVTTGKPEIESADTGKPEDKGKR